jgi:hypothetical protein
MLLTYSDNQSYPAPADPLQWPGRVLLALVAFGGTLAYAASFRALPDADALARPAAGVALAAAVAWPLFGAALLLVTGARPSPLDWADACLRTMAAGVVVLALAATLNLNVPLLGAAPPAPWVAAGHLALLVAANGVMLLVFVGEARRLGLRAATAATLWVLVLDGTFCATLLFLYRIGVT